MRWSQNFHCSGGGLSICQEKRKFQSRTRKGQVGWGTGEDGQLTVKQGVLGKKWRGQTGRLYRGTRAHFEEVSCTGLLWNQEPELWGEWGQVWPAGLRSIWQQGKWPEAGRASSGMMTDTVPQTVLFSKYDVHPGMGNKIIPVPKEESEPLRS